jgi:hypothetical protein
MSGKISTTSPSSAPTKTALTEEPDFFGPPPLITGEEPAAYVALLEQVSTAVRPQGILEKIWVRDIVDLVWETLRLRRLKANLLQGEANRGVRETIEPLIGLLEADDLSKEWARRTSKALRRVEGLLSAAGLTMDVVMAQTLDLKLDQVERIERLIASAEARRNNALREIDRHRAALGSAMRTAVEAVEDAEFIDVETASTPSETQ